MKLALKTRFMRGVLAKIIAKMIKKKYGHKVSVHINEINLEMQAGNAHVQATVELDMASEDFKKLLQDLVED